MGPEDPSEAIVKAPSSLRACYGKDIIHNAVYGSDSEEMAGKVCYFCNIYYIESWYKYSVLFYNY